MSSRPFVRCRALGTCTYLTKGTCRLCRRIFRGRDAASSAFAIAIRTMLWEVRPPVQSLIHRDTGGAVATS